MLDVYYSPRKFPQTFYDDFIYFVTQNDCSHNLTWLFALLFFYFYSCTSFIDSSQNFSALVLPLPQFHYCSLLHSSLNVTQSFNIFYHNFFLSFLTVIFILARSETGLISGNIYEVSNCGNTQIDMGVAGSG